MSLEIAKTTPFHLLENQDIPKHQNCRRASAMFNFKKKRENQYLYLVPVENDLARWELIDQAELEHRVEENLLEENAVLYKVANEKKIRSEKTTYLE
ncbi:hypothetical protein KKA14_02470 [bacterium]|nr:hypothetical protein [bacterium]